MLRGREGCLLVYVSQWRRGEREREREASMSVRVSRESFTSVVKCNSICPDDV